MEKVRVDDTRCIGCGACVGIAPETFDFNEDGLSEVINPVLTEEAKAACEACPVEAISIGEEVEEEKEA